MVLWTVCVPNVGRSDFHQQESHGTHVDSRWRAGAGLRRLAPVSESEEAQKPLRSFPDVSGAGTRVHWQELAPKGGRRGKDGTAERFRSGRGKAGASRAERGNSIPFVAGTAALLGVAGQGRRDGVDGSAHLRGSDRRSELRGSRKGPAGPAATAGRAQRPRNPRPADRLRGTGQARPRKRRCPEARARLGSGPAVQRAGKGRTSRVPGFGGPRVAAGTPVGGTRSDRADQGPDERAKQVHRRNARVSAAMRRPAVSRKRGAGGVGCAACTPASTVLARRQGALCPARTTARSQDRPWRLFHFRRRHFVQFLGSGFWGVGRWCRRSLSGTAGTPSATSEPDVPPGQQRREEVEDFAFLTRFG